MTSDVAQFVFDRLGEEIAEMGDRPGPMLQELHERLFMTQFREDEGDLSGLGAFAAEWAYHPDYQNWPCPRNVVHRNMPATDPGELPTSSDPSATITWAADGTRIAWASGTLSPNDNPKET